MGKLSPESQASSEVDAAIETFVRGFSFTRSLTHPYTAERIGNIWALRDAPRRGSDPYRRQEWVGRGDQAEELIEAVRKHAAGRFAICAICGDDEAEVRKTFKSAGFRLHTTEPMMVHALTRVPRRTSPATITRVLSADLADAIAKANGYGLVQPDYLVEGAPIRVYAARVAGSIVGWVRSITVGSATWCASMGVVPEQRRQGIASALLARMLRDDRSAGAEQSVLTASHTGAKLYVTLGYRQVGNLLLFNPPRSA